VKLKLIIVYFLFLQACNSGAQIHSQNLIGKWRLITDYSLPVSALDQEELNDIRSQDLSISNEGVQFYGNNNCRNIIGSISLKEYSTELVNMSNYCYDNRVTMGHLGIRSETNKVLSASKDGCYIEIILKQNGNILIPFKGVFFEYKR